MGVDMARDKAPPTEPPFKHKSSEDLRRMHEELKKAEEAKRRREQERKRPPKKD